MAMPLMGTQMIFIFPLMFCASITPVLGDGENIASDGDFSDIYLSVLFQLKAMAKYKKRFLIRCLLKDRYLSIS